MEQLILTHKADENPNTLIIRVSHDDIDMLTKVVTYAKNSAIVDLAVFEISKSGQRHIHMMFEPINITKSAWFQAFHKFFKNVFKGNKSYSCEKMRKAKFNSYCYMCKGTRTVAPDVMHTILSPEVIQYYYELYWGDKPVEKDFTQSVKKKATLTWSQQLTITLQQESPDHKWSYNAVSMDKILDGTLVALGNGSKKMNSFIIRDLALGQLNALTKGRDKTLNDKVRFEAFPDLFGIGGYAN